MMQVGAIWERWIEVLAGVLFAWREVWRARRVLIVQHANDGFVVRQAKPSGDRSIPQAGSEDISSIGFVSCNLVTPHDREPGEVISDTSLSTHLSDPDELRISAPLPGEAIRIDDRESSPTESTGDRSIPQAGSEDIESIGFVSCNLVTPHDREPGEVISDTSLSTHLSDPDELRISASLPGEAIRIDDPESSPTESAVLAAGSRAPDDVVRA